MKIKIKSNGFTLVEVLVSMTIFSVSVILIFAIYFLSQRFYKKSELRAEILQNARVVLERMDREMRQTQEIVTALPQVKDNLAFPPASEIEFQDGHNPSPYASLGSDYYYIRYFIDGATGEIHREYKVYCFENCGECVDFFRWNDSQITDGVPIQAHSCILEDRIVGECGQELKFYRPGPISVFLRVGKQNEQIDFQTNVYGRNL
ncbi:MAG: prepilin-type N-terminal cleavage/methylation domain-containing protein [Candidatus Pacebacteria bacterium]|nr:prepilin-type N-terminal cleavage/methylation domain-containing protein [Candidatus Paceibacterota bacterium]